MKNTIKTLGILGIATIIGCAPEQAPVAEEESNVVTTVVQPEPAPKKKVKLAILLDTSGSMSGLIEQAKNQLWKIVNQLAKAKDEHDQDPEIELALYQYGNDGLSVMSGYVEEISGFTSELDDISEKLFALQTNGGSEYCGKVIKTSLEELKWSDDPTDLQFIFIAGNEEFTQGDVPYGVACAAANSQNVVVNTIFCGNYQEGIRTAWKAGAEAASGKYMNIDHDAKIVHYDSPYDDQISELNEQLNDTYVPYGANGRSKKQNQIVQDNNAKAYGGANASKRYLSKSSKVYKNKSWDMVDATDRADFKIEEVQDAQLPEEMRGMSKEEKTAYVTSKKQKRNTVKSKMNELNKQREAFVAKKKAEDAKAGAKEQLEDVMIQAIVKQAKEKKYKFSDDIK